MKKLILPILLMVIAYHSGNAQGNTSVNSLQNTVAKLDKAQTAKDFETLEKELESMAVSQKTAWLPYYYAAYCNAKIGFMYENDGERIEPYSKRGEEQIKKAQALLDEGKQKKELAEVYTVTSMIYRTKVFINPMTYGRKYGVLSQQFMDKAKQIDAQNPRMLWLEAWVKYNTPKMWGGDKKLAKQLAEQSLAKLSSATSDVNPHWGKTENRELLSKYK